MEKVKWCI